MRVNAEGYGAGRVTAVDKFWNIVYIEYDEPYDKHGTRKRAHVGENTHDMEILSGASGQERVK